MPEPRPLPHNDYVTAVMDALTAASLEPTEFWLSGGETKGTYCYLNAVITLDPSSTFDRDHADVPAGTPWRHGLLLSWEWHTGLEDGGPEKGPLWEFAELKADGSIEYPTSLPVHGYASPAAIVEAARKVIDHSIGPGHSFNLGQPRWDGGLIGASWERADELAAACEAWGAEEGAE
ncbi:hypothetical protein [Streptomyces sp. PD-S100-1]|uniref:hypothetical protein n=1 Tax=Streptomyces sp. PD-S100-1 TaxID=3394351 RepID=UPI0039BCF658